MDPLRGQPPWVVLLTSPLVGFLLAAIATWPVCSALLGLYRRRIATGMRPAITSPDPEPTIVDGAGQTSGPPSSRQIAVRVVQSTHDHQLLARARRSCLRVQTGFVLAGLLYGAAWSSVYHLTDEEPSTPSGVIAYLLLASWPIVPTVLALSTRRRTTRRLLWPGYLMITIAVLYAAGVGPETLPASVAPLAELVAAVACPMLCVVATSARALRGAAWLVVPGLVALGTTVSAWLLVGAYLRAAVPFDPYAWAALVLGVALPLVAIGYTWAVIHLYQAKWLSDQTLLILQWWLVNGLWWGLLIGVQGPLATGLSLLPYAVLVVVLLLVLGRNQPSAGRPIRLLLLRTFGARERSSRLLHDLTRQWRWVGSVELITAPDLASETLEPDEFLDFTRGRLRERFVQDDRGVERRLERLDLGRDRDGRYRINELMCSDDTWRLALDRLAGDTDVIVIDLRGFSADHPGVDHELQRVVALHPLPRVVAVVDDSTDEDFLHASLDRAAVHAPASSPLHSDPDPALQVIGWRTSRGVDQLLAALARAVS